MQSIRCVCACTHKAKQSESQAAPPDGVQQTSCASSRGHNQRARCKCARIVIAQRAATRSTACTSARTQRNQSVANHTRAIVRRARLIVRTSASQVNQSSSARSSSAALRSFRPNKSRAIQFKQSRAQTSAAVLIAKCCAERCNAGGGGGGAPLGTTN